MDRAVNKAILKAFVYYSIAIGVTSHRMADTTLESSPFTRIYAWAVNILMLVLLPIFLGQSFACMWAKSTLPWLVLATFCVRRLVTLFIIFYSILSRVSRDKALKKMQPMLSRLMRNEGLCERRLSVLFYPKCFTLSLMLITEFFFAFFELDTMDWSSFAKFLIMTSAHNIIFYMPMGYFLVLWHIAGGFIYVNRHMDELIKAPRSDLEELKRLWSLHAALTRAALRINRIYSPQILAIRLDTFVFAVVEMYWGTFFTFRSETPILWLVYGGVTYCNRLGLLPQRLYVRLAGQVQSSATNTWTECDWRKEVSSNFTH